MIGFQKSCAAVALTACIVCGIATDIFAMDCLRMRPTGTVEASDDWSWKTLEHAAIGKWQFVVAEKTGVHWNHWKWENAIQREITREEKGDKRIVRATAAPCR